MSRIEELVLAARDGDRGAWIEIVSEFEGLVWRVARTYRLTESDALDVCQSTWLKVVTKLETLREPERFAGWITTIAEREALTLLRRANREQPTEDVAAMALEPLSDESDQPLLERELVHQVRQAFLTLSAQCRLLLTVLLAEPSPSYTEAADILGMPIGSIGPRRQRCLQSLRVSMGAAG